MSNPIEMMYQGTIPNIMNMNTPYSLKDCVQMTVQMHLATVGGKNINNLYELVLGEMEQAMIERVLDYTDGNESRTAKILGISRGTLRQRRKAFGHYDRKYRKKYTDQGSFQSTAEHDDESDTAE